ncbi:hypothetical protein [Rhizobium tumorigenes]|uniref:Uncharacterized protein n=1 Tax=Rhizobium tumorigenes TaxID=2041385 RepID=A0AAF1KCF0_9HYPH|nr:hypothetical protein [Rhizobium tumorigenes]WFR99404.1 hypothetical protein PR017_27625 [Rhizobium tumorigenes]
MQTLEVSPGSHIVTSINAAYEAVRAKKQPTGAIAPTRFYGTDAGHHYHVLVIKGIVCGLGGRYNTMPAKHLFIALADVSRA